MIKGGLVEYIKKMRAQGKNDFAALNIEEKMEFNKRLLKIQSLPSRLLSDVDRFIIEHPPRYAVWKDDQIIGATG